MATEHAQTADGASPDRPAPPPGPPAADGPPPPLRPENRAGVLEEIRERADTVWTHAAAARADRAASAGGAAPADGSGRGGRNGFHEPLTVTRREDLKGKRGRIAIVDGCRTPFSKAGGVFQNMDVVDLASAATAELIERPPVDPAAIDLSVFGVVVPALHAPNLGREGVFRPSLPMSVPGVPVNPACASSTRAITFVAEAMLAGEGEVGLARGPASLTNLPIHVSPPPSPPFLELRQAPTIR